MDVTELALVDSSADKTGAFVRFTPDVKKEGAYNIYIYIAKVTGVSFTYTIVVNTARNKKELI